MEDAVALSAPCQYYCDLVSHDSDLQRFPQRAIEFPRAGSFLIDQNISDVGTTLWDAEIVLSYFVESENIKGSVVELGCGTALASMVCSRLGCQVAVQELPEVLESTKCVLAANSVSVSHAFGVTWGPEFVSVLKTTGMCNYFDNIIMADVLYHCEDFEDLIVSILHCSAVKCRLYVCFEQRRRNLDAFFSSVELYFDRTSCIKHSIRNEESGRITIIYAMKFETRNNLGFLSQEA